MIAQAPSSPPKIVYVNWKPVVVMRVREQRQKQRSIYFAHPTFLPSPQYIYFVCCMLGFTAMCKQELEKDHRLYTHNTHATTALNHHDTSKGDTHICKTEKNSRDNRCTKHT